MIAFFHNDGKVLVAMLVLNTYLIYGRVIGRLSCSNHIFIPSMPALAFRGSLHIVLMIACDCKIIMCVY